MARIKKERKRKGRKGKERDRYYKNAQKCYTSHPCSGVPDGAIKTKFGTAIDDTYVMTSANFGFYQLRDGHLAVVQNFHFPITSVVGLTTGKHYRAAVINSIVARAFARSNLRPNPSS